MYDENPLRFRCHTGHTYSVGSLLAEVSENIEDEMWSTIRSIEESVMLMRHVAEHLKNGDTAASERFLHQADEAQQRADIFRQAIMSHEKSAKKNQ